MPAAVTAAQRAAQQPLNAWPAMAGQGPVSRLIEQAGVGARDGTCKCMCPHIIPFTHAQSLSVARSDTHHNLEQDDSGDFLNLNASAHPSY